jgi:endonuclease/exonuclease/phosphatase family metal-dependent hydrolase
MNNWDVVLRVCQKQQRPPTLLGDRRRAQPRHRASGRIATLIVRITSLATAAYLTGCTGRVTPAPPLPQKLLECAPGVTCIRIVSWNLHGLPWPLSRDPLGRMRNIAAVIAEQQPDVVALQEVWFGAYLQRLIDDLRDTYTAERLRRIGSLPRGGLAILVRKNSGWSPDGTPIWMQYERSAPAYRIWESDGISAKGLLALRLRRDDRQRFVLVDTHLQSQYPENGRDYVLVRRDQLDELEGALTWRFHGEPILITGDFNTRPFERLYATHIKSLGNDLTADLRTACGPWCGTNIDARDGHHDWIDYVIARTFPVHAQATLVRNDGMDWPYSDHDGLLVRLEPEPNL